ncbi:hypothetical protein GWK47_043126 [Chionoecetes opilio]|uniref:Uncharacterized protein n=1 Tax=Chionoecetes opilio TaxID=41210 RepID=A0A8J4YAM6_CHIOP|nr:hypothetical protein GWK47_043126 [Chionoecetes opilio]
MICCTLSDVEWSGTGSTTTAGAEHRAWKLAPHTATFPTSTCSLRCAATADQLENVLRGVGYTVLHISRDETLVSVISFPPVFHCSESWWIPTQGTVPVSDLMVCSTNVLLKRFCSWGKLHSFGAAVDLPVFCAIASGGSWSSKRLFKIAIEAQVDISFKQPRVDQTLNTDMKRVNGSLGWPIISQLISTFLTKHLPLWLCPYGSAWAPLGFRGRGGATEDRPALPHGAGVQLYDVTTSLQHTRPLWLLSEPPRDLGGGGSPRIDPTGRGCKFTVSRRPCNTPAPCGFSYRAPQGSTGPRRGDGGSPRIAPRGGGATLRCHESLQHTRLLWLLFRASGTTGHCARHTRRG